MPGTFVLTAGDSLIQLSDGDDENLSHVAVFEAVHSLHCQWQWQPPSCADAARTGAGGGSPASVPATSPSGSPVRNMSKDKAHLLSVSFRGVVAQCNAGWKFPVCVESPGQFQGKVIDTMHNAVKSWNILGLRNKDDNLWETQKKRVQVDH